MVAQNDNRAGTSPAPTIGEIVGSFKSLCVYKCKNNGINIPRLWQRNYYEHIIRNENELNEIREYIINNPMRWEFDRENVCDDSSTFCVEETLKYPLTNSPGWYFYTSLTLQISLL